MKKVRQKFRTIYIQDPDHLCPDRSKGRYGARIAVAFSAKDPLQMAAYRVLARLRSDALRDLLGIPTYKALLDASESEGMKPAAYIRSRIMRLRFEGSDSEKKEIVSRIRAQLGSDLPRVTPFTSAGVNIEDSPEEVRRLLDRYAPGAKRVLDPFAGTANVAIVAAERGLDGYWCEIDPVVASIGQLKIDLLIRTPAARRQLASEVRTQKNRMRGRIAAYRAAGDLGDLEAPPELVEYARQCRSLIDFLSPSQRLVARVLEAAAAEALTRVEQKEHRIVTQAPKLDAVAQFSAALEQELNSVISFLHQSRALVRIPQFLAADAETSGDIISIDADVVVTAPPPITLDAGPAGQAARWFMRFPPRALPARSRADAVSSIRKIISGKLPSKTQEITSRQIGFDIIESIGLRELILEIDDQGEPDLARAVAHHFVQMGRAIEAIEHHISDDATFILDVTDFNLGSIHVEADLWFGRLLGHYGFVRHDDLPVAAGVGAAVRRVIVFRRKGSS